jgi:pyridoxamine 5'-phosphate oxidase
LALRFAEAEKRFEGKPVERPPHWGGYRLVVDHVEFWTGQPSRLHLREIFTLTNGTWASEVVGP